MFNHYSPATAPEATQATLETIEKQYGFIPNLYAYLAESPVALDAYLHINDQLMNRSSLKPADVQLALLAISDVNGCEFCVAAHSMGTAKTKANEQSVSEVRDGKPVSDPRDAALVNFVRALVSERGFVPEETSQALLDAGFSRENLFDLLVCNMLKTLSNYANHLTGTEVNPELAKFAR